MNAAELIAHLAVQGIMISSDGDRITARIKHGKITDDQKSLIVAHKPILLAHFQVRSDAHNDGSPLPKSSAPALADYFKEYKLPDGTTLQLSRNEFNNVVDLFRILLQQSEKPRGHQAG